MKAWIAYIADNSGNLQSEAIVLLTSKPQQADLQEYALSGESVQQVVEVTVPDSFISLPCDRRLEPESL